MSCTLRQLAEKTPGFTAFPTGKSERWRFSQLKAWLDTPFENDQGLCKEVTLDTPYTIVIENGEPVAQKLPAGFEMTTSNPAPAGHAENPFASFNSAYAPPLALTCRTSPDAPLHILYRYDPGLRHSSMQITLADGVEMELVESFCGGEKSFITHRSGFELHAQSRLQHTLIQDLDSSAAMIGETLLKLREQADAKLFLLLKGAQFHQHFTACDLYEKSRVALHALQLGHGAQRQVLCTDFIHKAPSGRSSQLARQVLYGESTGVFDGKALIEQGAQGSVATQGSHALLLSKKAQIHAKPHLEIYTDDLQASHGSTVGELDEQALAYLQSRGIPENKARAMMIDAFTADLLENIGNPAVKTVVQSLTGEAHDAQPL